MSAVENGDKLGLLLFHGGADFYIPPRKGGKHALRVVREVLGRGEAERPELVQRSFLRELSRAVRRLFARLQQETARAPRSATSIAAALEFCRPVLPRRAVVFLVSDFLGGGDLQVLRHANRKHDVVAALITDPREAQMPPAGLVTLEDAETGEARLVDTRSPAFREELAARGRAREAELRDQQLLW